MTSCSKCGAEVSGNYCSYCGQPAELKRINGHYIVHEIEHVLHFEKGILYTVRELLIRPGQNIRKFLSNDRSRLVKPIIYIIITSLIFTIISHFFGIEDKYVHVTEDKKTSITFVFDWVRDHYGYSNIIMGIFIALWLKVFFRKAPYNFFEILIVLCFVMGTSMLLMAVFTLIEGLTKVSIVQPASFLFLIYCAWALGEFFSPRKAAGYIKAVLAYVLGMITFTAAAWGLGMALDLVLT